MQPHPLFLKLHFPMAEKPVLEAASTVSMGVMEERVREQIRVLQEKRAAAMSNEITELQRERDMAVARSRFCQKKLDEFQAENNHLKSLLQSEKGLQQELKSLERVYLEEKLLNKDLRKKLQEKAELVAKVQAGSPLLQHRIGEKITPGSRSLSLSNLSKKDDGNNAGEGNSTPQGRKHTSTKQSISVRLTPSPSPSPSGSPAVIPRRYKLLSTTTVDKESQTHLSYEEESSSALDAARSEMLSLQARNQSLEQQLNTKVIKTTGSINELAHEAATLRQSLTEISLWIQQKICKIEEEMDVCKVIYSLHGSLSQEAKVIEELGEKLRASEASVHRLMSENNGLKEALAESDRKRKTAKKELYKMTERLNRCCGPGGTTQPSPLLRKMQKRASNGQSNIQNRDQNRLEDDSEGEVV